MPWSGEWARASRVRGGLEQSGDLLEGVPSPRARQKFARGGAEPSSEVEIHPRQRQALERGGDWPEGASAPRSRRKFARGLPRLAA
jgi:hypothetical protein